MSEGYDVASVRGLYTGLSDGWTYLNAHDTPQISEKVAAGVARSFRTSTAVSAVDLSGGSHSAPQRAGRLEGEAHIDAARVAVADLVGVTAERVVLGSNLPMLYQALARSMSPMLRRNSSVVLSHLDPPNLSSAFSESRAEVRWAQPDLGTGELPAFQYADLVDGSTRLVSLSAAHELLGTVTPTEEIIDLVRERSRAWTLVDVSAIAPYSPVDFNQLGADIVGIDLAQLGGPQVAALAFRDTAMFKRLDALSSDHEGPGAAKLETPVSTGLAGGVGPLVDHLASLGTSSRGSRRTRLGRSMAALQAHMNEMRDDLYTLMSTLPAVHIMGITGEAAAEARIDNRIPRLSFAVRGVPAATVHQRLFANRLVTTQSPLTPLLISMGAEEVGGTVTVALGPFNTHYDIEHLIRVVASLA